jgi:hypothetical protein
MKPSKTMNHSIRCHCGKLKGTLNYNQAVNRCVCYCSDCQAFARFLKREHEILDEFGGTSIIQTLPANVSFTEGVEHLSCMRLTAKGMLRWYAACCNSAIGNTLPTPNLSFIGLIHTCLDSDQTPLDEAFGSIRMYINTQSTIREHKPKSAGVLPGTLRLLGMMLRARLDGSYKQTPFFFMESGTPIVVPKVLTAEELKSVKNSV